MFPNCIKIQKDRGASGAPVLLCMKNRLHGTPGPVWNGGSKGEEELLKSCYESCLKLAAEKECRTVAFPSISTGIYRFPLERASVIAVRTILSFCQSHPEIEEVQMVCFDERTKGFYDSALQKENLLHIEI